MPNPDSLVPVNHWLPVRSYEIHEWPFEVVEMEENFENKAVIFACHSFADR
jgi:hypothetical protein